MSELTLTQYNFEDEVLSSVKPVLVDFWAPWCGPCQRMAPIIEQLAKELDGQVVVGKVNVEEETELAAKYGVMSIPTVKVFKDGDVVASAVGVRPKDMLLNMIGIRKGQI